MNAWIALLIAGLLEIAWAIGLKASRGFERPLISTLTVIGMLASFWFLTIAMRTLPLGTAYAVWTGIGAVGAAILGILIYKDPATAVRLGSIALIVAGIAGLRLSH